MIALLLELFDELRLFWAPRPWNRPRKGFNPAQPMSDAAVRRFASRGLIKEAP